MLHHRFQNSISHIHIALCLFVFHPLSSCPTIFRALANFNSGDWQLQLELQPAGQSLLASQAHKARQLGTARGLEKVVSLYIDQFDDLKARHSVLKSLFEVSQQRRFPAWHPIAIDRDDDHGFVHT